MGKITAVSPLAPDHFPDLPVIDGVRFATIAAGVRYQGRTDVMLAELAPGSTVAGAFTRSATRAAPVLDCQAKIGATSDSGAAILVNSGNAAASPRSKQLPLRLLMSATFPNRVFSPHRPV